MAITNEGLILDESWVKAAFCVPHRMLRQADARRRTYTDAKYNFTNTQLGGNFAINAKPQYSCVSDIPPDTGISSLTEAGGRMSRGYLEAIEQNVRTIHIRAGVPEYNSLTTFFAGAVDPDAEALVRTGGTAGIAYTVGRMVGFVVSMPLIPIVALGRGWRFLMDKPYGRYYYLKPTMNILWNTATTIANRFMVDMGFNPGTFNTDSGQMDETTGWADSSSSLSQSQIAEYANLMPSMFHGVEYDDAGNVVGAAGIDVYAVATRAARADIKQRERLSHALDNADTEDAYVEAMRQYHESDDILVGNAMVPGNRNASMANLQRYNQSYQASQLGQIPPEPVLNAQQAAESIDGGELQDAENTLSDWADESTLGYLQAEFEEGAQWLTLQVTGDKTSSLSVSSTFKESDIASTLNGISSSARSATFNFMGGNLGDGAIAGAIEGVVGSANDLITGVTDSLGLSGLAVFRGRSFLDIPQMWENSQVNLPKLNYKITLDPGAGDKFTLLTKQMVPLSCIMALAFPRSTGMSTYGPPMLCEVYDQAFAQSKLCMVSSCNITRGDGMVGWTVDKMATKITIDLEFIDLSKMMAVPVANGFSVKDFFALNMFDDDSAFTEQMAVITGMGLHEQISKWEKIKRRWNYRKMDFESHFSASHAINYAASTLPGRAIGAFFRTTNRV